jgi:predicted RNA-binding protein YlxR (DUF448 family)
VPERTCIVTREAGDPADLIRFVRAPDGTVVPDLAGKLPGRGAWVSLSRERLEQALKRCLLDRALSRGEPATADPGLADRVEDLLADSALRLLTMARKAGGLVTGFDKVSAAIAKGEALVLIEAADASPDGARKLVGPFLAGASRNSVVGEFTNAQLSLAMGRSNVVHAALTNRGLSEKFLNAVRRLRTYRGQTGPGNEENE